MVANNSYFTFLLRGICFFFYLLFNPFRQGLDKVRVALGSGFGLRSNVCNVMYAEYSTLMITHDKPRMTAASGSYSVPQSPVHF